MVNKARKKFKKRFVVIPLVCLLVVGGIAAFIIYSIEDSKYAKVVPMTDEMMDLSYFMDYYGESLYGTLKEGSVQNVTLNPTLKIEEVLVKKGDEVKKGDPLIRYDVESLKLNVEEAKGSITAIENNQKIAENQLAVLKKLLPAEDAPTEEEEPPVDEPDIPIQTGDTPPAEDDGAFPKEITAKSVPLGGKGTEDEPYIYYAAAETVVKADFLSAVAAESSEGENTDKVYVRIDVFAENGAYLFSRLICSDMLSDDNIKDTLCSEGVDIDKNGRLSFDAEQSSFAEFAVYVALSVGSDNEEIPQTDFDFDMSDFMSDMQSNTEFSDELSTSSFDEITTEYNYVFTREELKKQISEKEKEIEDLTFQKRQAEINLTKAENLAEVGAEKATMDGTVSFVAKSEKNLSSSGAYITITNSGGVSVAVNVSEFKMSEVFIGMTADIMNYSDGSNYTGTVTYIANRPSDTASGDLKSYYEVTLSVDGDLELAEDAGLDVRLNYPSSDSGAIFALNSAFIREENGRHYVMADNNGIIEKRYVTTGKEYYGIATEIISGLDYDDKLAFPYGNTAEGMPTKEVSFYQMYFSGLLS